MPHVNNHVTPRALLIQDKNGFPAPPFKAPPGHLQAASADKLSTI